MFNSRLDWLSKKNLFLGHQVNNGFESSNALFNLIFDAPELFDESIINYQVSKTNGLIQQVKQKIINEAFQSDESGIEVVNSIDWSVFHRQIFPSVCAAQIMNCPIQQISDFVYCYAFFIIGPTQILDDKLDNPFAPELNLKKYAEKELTGLWAISDLMIRKGVQLFIQLSPESFKYIAPLAFDMSYSMYRENRIKNYNEEILTNPRLILQLYSGIYPPDLSSIFNETMFIGAFIHLRLANKEVLKWVPLSRNLRLLSQQLNELEDFIVDLLSGFIKKPAALLLNDKEFGGELRSVIQSKIWNKENLELVREKSFLLSQTEYCHWLAQQDYTKIITGLFMDSGILEGLYHRVDELCFNIVTEMEDLFGGKNYFDLLTMIFLKKALLERLNRIGFLPQKVENRCLGNLNE